MTRAAALHDAIQFSRGVARWLSDRAFWPVAVLIGASAAWERLLLPALAVGVLFWPVRWLAYRRFSVRTAGDWALGGLLLMIPITLWATALPQVTQTRVLQLLAGVALYYAVVNWAQDWARLRWLVIGLASVALGLALIAPFSTQLIGSKFAFLPKTLARLPMLLSDTVNPNVMAGSLAILVPLALARLLFEGRRLQLAEAALLWAVTGVAPIVMLLTQSRGALVSLAVAVLAVIALRWRWGWLATPLGILAGVVVVWRVGLDRIAALFSAGSSIGGLSGRPEVWSRALYMIQDFPFTGVGMGLYGRVAALLYPFFTISPDVEVPHAHNLFLQVAVDLGLPGLVAWLALLLLVCAVAWQIYRWDRTADRSAPPSLSLPNSPTLRFSSSPTLNLAGLGAGLLASQVALIVHGLTDAVTWGTRPAVVVWAIWGVAMASYNLVTARTSAEETQMNLENSS